MKRHPSLKALSMGLSECAGPELRAQAERIRTEHGQLREHQPPFQQAAWVTDEAGRRERLGMPMPCVACRMPRMPPCAAVYKSTEVFDAASLPAGLRRSHRLRAGTWGRIVVLQGRVRYVLEDEGELMLVLRPGVDGVVAPERPHHVEPDADARLQVHFLRSGGP